MLGQIKLNVNIVILQQGASKHSGIPSLNVCMNCHRNIAEYNGEEDFENGYTKDFYTKETKNYTPLLAG